MRAAALGSPSVSTLLLLSCFLQLLASNCFSATVDVLNALAKDARLVNGQQLLAPLQETDRSIKVIVSLKPPAGSNSLNPKHLTKPGNNKGNAAFNLKDKQGKQQLRRFVATGLTHFLEKIDPAKVHLRRRFEYTFAFAATVTAAGLEELLAQPDLSSISEDILLQAHTSQGVSLMNGDTTRSAYDGSGIAIAIVDTGIDTTHPALGNSITFPNAKIIGGYDTGDNDSDPRPNPNSGNAHGTACAGIAGGDIDATGDYIGGVAPAAKLYALKISLGDSDSALASSMIAAWEWCISHQYDDPNHPILIINTSFGGGKYAATCDNIIPAMTQAAANAVTAGITLFASAGNEGYCDALSWPACISTVNSVGAVYDTAFGNYLPCISSDSCADKTFTTSCGNLDYYATDVTTADMVTSYSNSSPSLTLFAPSNMAYTADISGPGGYTAGDYISSFGGTSAASPYAAGAAAALQQAMKTKTGNYLTPAQVQSFLTTSGNLVTDGKSAIAKPRINLGNAIHNLPTGTIYTITAISGAGGTLAPSGQIIVAENDQQSFSIQASSGYQIAEVTVDGNSIGAVGSYTFNTVTADHTISVTFETIQEESFFWWLPFIIALTSGHSN